MEQNLLGDKSLFCKIIVTTEFCWSWSHNWMID